MDISALLDFNLVVRHGGFSPASRASGRPKATLSRKVIELEAQMGVRLFERGAKGLRLTDAGAALHARTAGHFAEIEAAAGAIEREDGSLSGRLRVSAPVLFAHAHLGRIATEFSLAHPAVELFVVADDSIADLVEDQYDVVIRANPRADEGLVGRCFVRTDRVAVAAPAFPRAGNDERVRVVDRIGESTDAQWRLRDGSSLLTLQPDPMLHLSSLLMVRDAVLLGAGAALLPRTMIEEDLAAGRLVEWGVEEGVQTELWALHTSRRLVSDKVRAFLRCLDKTFASPRA